MRNGIIKFIMFIFVGMCVFVNFNNKVYADDDIREICSTYEQSKLERKAQKVEFTYTLKFNADNKPYFEVMYLNLQAGLEIRYGENTYVFDDDKSSGIIQNSFANNGETYEFKIYAAYGYPCVGELLHTEKVKLPKYNIYSEYDECITYEEFPMCRKWYDGEIKNEAHFYEELEKYKKSLEKPEEKPPVVEEEKNLFEKFIEFYLNNLIITVPVTVIIVIAVVVLVIRSVIRRKNRVKIDI